MLKMLWIYFIAFIYYQVHACPNLCRCTNTSVYCFYKGITTNDLISIAQDIPTHVTKLYLAGNAIEILPTESLSHLKNLQYLSLNFNQLTSLPHNISDHLPSLKELYLTANRIEEINSLAGYENIVMLNLNQNYIKVLPEYIFSTMKSLKYLLLGQNQIQNINKNIFHGLTYLYKLQLNNNKMNYIHKMAFHHTENIQEIYLHDNELTEIEDSLFSNLSKLNVLYLTNNRISKIGEQAFNNLKLQILYLVNNKLTKLPINSFDNTYIEQEIYMNGNEFQCNCQLIMDLRLESHFNQLYNKGKINLGECIDSQTNSPKLISSLEMSDFNCTVCLLKPCKQNHICISYPTIPLSYNCLPIVTVKPKTDFTTTEMLSIASLTNEHNSKTEIENTPSLALWITIGIVILTICVSITLLSLFLYQRKKKKEFFVAGVNDRRLTYDKVRYSQDTLLDNTMRSNTSSDESTFKFCDIVHV